jgi:gliding motility-associated lipoprotein GldH
MSLHRKTVLFLLTGVLYLASCTSVGVFEENSTFKNQEWASNNKPTIHFNISDTTVPYNVYLVLRHTDAYNYNNVWLKWTVQQPGDSVKRTQQFDLRLASNDKGWLGSGMDDIYEHRMLVQPKTIFQHPGDYSVTLEHIMREDPLLHVLSVGLRVEKVQ